MPDKSICRCCDALFLVHGHKTPDPACPCCNGTGTVWTRVAGEDHGRSIVTDDAYAGIYVDPKLAGRRCWIIVQPIKEGR